MLPRLKRARAELVPALFGPPLATYTATLDLRHGDPRLARGAARAAVRFRRERRARARARPRALVLPPRDGGPGAAARGRRRHRRERRRCARWRSGSGIVGEPYRQGAAGKLKRLGKASTAAARRCSRGAAAEPRGAAVAGGALVLGGELRCAGRSSRPASSRPATRSTSSARNASAAPHATRLLEPCPGESPPDMACADMAALARRRHAVQRRR